MEKILLIDHDLKSPNIALMKLSSYHKSKGDRVFLDYCDGVPDYTYISKVFKRGDRPRLRGPGELGGPGTRDELKRLPPDIESLMPDYSLYDCEYSIGFTTRGCIRKCGFCSVWKREGSFRVVNDLYGIWQPGHRRIVFLDNNILSNADHFELIAKQILKEKLFSYFEHGIDIRLTDDNNLSLFKRLAEGFKEWRFFFAWDFPGQADLMRSLIERALKYIRPYRMVCLMITGYDSTHEEDCGRVAVLRSLKVRPFVMVYARKRYSDRYDTDVLAEYRNYINFFHDRVSDFPGFLKSTGKGHLIADIGREVHRHKITGPRSDGQPRRGSSRYPNMNKKRRDGFG